MSRTCRSLSYLLLVAVVSLASVGCSGSAAVSKPQSGAGAAAQAATPAEQLARTKCTMCHTFDRVTQAKKDAAGWQETVDRMVANGLVVSPAEKQEILGYLTTKDN